MAGLAFIEIKSENPFDLFKEWYAEARQFSIGSPNAFCLATADKGMKVSTRFLILRRLDKDGFVLLTDKRSLKSQQLADVPSASMCFLWSFMNDRQQHITKQVRIDGVMKALPREEYEDIYESEPIFCKIRSFICPQGKEVNWDELKKKYDTLVEEVNNGRKLHMPDHVQGYKMYANGIEFYYTYDQLIADRILFTKDSSSNSWKQHRIAA